MGLHLATDHTKFDGLENVTLDGGAVSDAYRLPVDLTEAEGTEGVYLKTDVIFQLPTAPVITPTVASVIVATGVSYNVLGVRPPFKGDFWGCTCRESAITADVALRDLISLWPAVAGEDEYGSRLVTHPAVDAAFEDIPGRVQKRPADIKVMAGKRQFDRVFDIYVARDINLKVNDLVKDQDGIQYEVISWKNRERIDVLSHIVGGYTD